MNRTDPAPWRRRASPAPPLSATPDPLRTGENVAGSARPTVQLVGQSAAMRRVFELIEIYAQSDAPVLICGESGTGKEVVARALHERSNRCDRPFVAVNCVGFPDTMIEDELFGHERGAFTDAIRKREGRFQAADHGFLFLDEVGEMPLPVQAKLLRVIESGAFEPLGTNRTVRVDVRIVSATHRDLGELVAERRFREDLYYRLKVLDLMLPPLRDRSEDLRLLVEHFLRAMVDDDAIPSLTDSAWAALYSHPFPGNVRELEHIIKRAVVLSRGARIDLEHLLPARVAPSPRARPEGPDEILPLADALRACEREHIVRALRVASGHRRRTARTLGISRKTLWEKMRAYTIRPGEFGT